jgi:hypothetical protein
VHASHAIQAHSSGQGFIAAAGFAIAGLIVAIVLINARKQDVPDSPMAAVAAA